MKGKKADISVDIIFTFIILIFSIFLLLALFSSRLSGFSKELYCKTVFYVHSSSFIPARYRQKPSFCEYTNTLKTVTIEPKENTLSSFNTSQGEYDKLTCNSSQPVFLTYSLDASHVDEFKFSVRLSELKPTNLSISFCNKTESFILREGISTISLSKKNFLDCSNNSIITFLINSDNPVQIYSPILKFEKCPTNDFIVAQLLNCWAKFNHGSYGKSQICEALALSNKCPEFESSEENITKILKKNNLCAVLPNKDYDNCGSEDKLTYNITKIRHNMNYIIKFNAKKSQLVME